MEIQELITFVTIVKQGSFCKASQKLGYSQAAVTIHIKNLETELNVKLFDRLSKKTTLTSYGKIFYEHSIQILNELSIAKESVTSTDELYGTLTIGTTDSLCASHIPELLFQFHKIHPYVSISIITDTIDGLIHMLNNNDIDFAYLVDQKIVDSHFIKVIEQEERAVFVASKNHPLINQKYLDLKTILSYPFILTEKDASYRQLLDYPLTSRRLEIKPIIQAKSTNLILEMMKYNMGISFLPEFVLNDDFKKLEVSDFQISIYKQVLYHKNKWVSKEMKAFFQLLEKENVK